MLYGLSLLYEHYVAGIYEQDMFLRAYEQDKKAMLV